ncbi:hypothetical protein ACFV6B_03625 [Streptomyces microflavus]|uniref:hypothetical protein n=1 Tax=Streptomyces microflavus TaxID=1919 RepID=UPI00365AF03C
MTTRELMVEASEAPTTATGPRSGRLRTVVPWTPVSLLVMQAVAFHSARYLAQRGIRQFVRLSGADGFGASADFPARRPCTGVPDTTFVHVAPPASRPKAISRVCALRHDRTVFNGVLPLLRTHAVETLGRQGPVGILIDDSGPWANNFADLQFTLNTLRGWLPPGSAIALTHTTDDNNAVLRQHHRARATAVLARDGDYPSRPLPRGQIRSLLEPWPLSEHGLLPTSAFLAELRRTAPSTRPFGSYAAIALYPEAT